MTTISRRVFVASATTVPLIGMPYIGSKAAQTFSLKYGNNLPLSHPLNIRAKEAVDRIKIETNGAVVISIHPNNQLGGDSDMLSLVRAGSIDFFTPSALVVSTLVPTAPINAVGFAFSSYDQVWAAMDGDLGAFVRSSIEKVDLHMMDKVWDNGFRQCTSSLKPINSPDDLKGLKIRVPVSPLSTSLFKALSAEATPMQFSELYSALQLGVLAAQENPLTIINTARFFEVQKYVSLTSHVWDGFLFIASGKTWNRLPEDLRVIVSRAIDEAGVKQRADIANLMESVRAELEAKGMIFNKPDPAPFREALRKAGFYAEWKERFGAEAWGILEKNVGQLA